MNNRSTGFQNSVRATRSPDQAERTSGSPRPPIVLVIEPSLTLRTLLPIMLRRLCYARVFAFPDALVALRHLRGPDLPAPDVILLTKDLPRLSGYAAARMLKHRCPNAKVIMVMEDEGCLGSITARLSGARDIVLKPYTLQDVQRVIGGVEATQRDQ